MSNTTKTNEMTLSRACDLVEDFQKGTAKEIIEAWAYLIKTGMCWSLQGWYGRQAQHFIDSGWFTETGEINWPVIENKEGNIF